jgi:hypothetical protein
MPPKPGAPPPRRPSARQLFARRAVAVILLVLALLAAWLWRRPPALTALLAVMGRPRPCTRAFSWYLDQAHPSFAET